MLGETITQSSLTATEIWDDSTPYNPTESAIMIDTGTNNVGIGTSNPLCRLYNYQDKSSGWAAQSYFGNDTEGFIAGSYNNIACIGGHNSSLSAWTDIALAPQGKVGIGTFNPTHPLTIYSKVNSGETGNGRGYTNTGITSWYDGIGEVSLRVHGRVWATDHYIVTSDSRIKTDISLISDDTALNLVNALESYEYHYIDPERKQPMKTIGFIAQEVNNVVPNAVSIQTDYIPDEMRMITDQQWTEDASNNWLEIPDLDMSSNFTEKAKFYVSNDPSGNDEVCKEVQIEPDKKTFVFDQSWNNVFFYGKEVNDLQTIDKNQIFALHHSAIQELDRKHKREVTEKNNEIPELRSEVNSLTSRMEALEASVLALQNN